MSLNQKLANFARKLIPGNINKLFGIDSTGEVLLFDPATTPQFDNTYAPATTSFIKRAGLQHGSVTPFTGTLYGTASHVGGVVYGWTTSINSYVFPDPVSNNIPEGATIKIWNLGSNNLTLSTAGADRIMPLDTTTRTTYSVPPGSEVVAVWNTHSGPSCWFVGGTGILGVSNDFAHSFPVVHGLYGYQKFPGGLIMQWGEDDWASLGPASQPITVSFPIAFPNMCTSFVSSIGVWRFNYDDDVTYRASRQDISFGLPSNTSVQGQIFFDNYLGNSRAIQWIAVGF